MVYCNAMKKNIIAEEVMKKMHPKKRLIISIILLFLGFIYLISPIDFIPEILVPVIGWIDDIGVLFVTFINALISFIRYKKSEEKTEKK